MAKCGTKGFGFTCTRPKGHEGSHCEDSPGYLDLKTVTLQVELEVPFVSSVDEAIGYIAAVFDVGMGNGRRIGLDRDKIVAVGPSDGS